MPKYTVDEVLEIIRNLSADEQQQLRKQWPSALEPARSGAGGGNTGSVSLRDINAGNNSNTKILGQGTLGDRSINQPVFHLKPGVSEEALALIAELMEQLSENSAAVREVDRQTRQTVLAHVEVLDAELTKSDPDKSLVDRAAGALQSVLGHTVNLAPLATRLAELLAKAWLPS